MIVKCQNNIIFDIPEDMKVVTCPSECPRRRICTRKNFIPIKTMGTPAFSLINNPIVKEETIESKPIMETPINIEEPTITPQQQTNNDDILARLGMLGGMTIEQPIIPEVKTINEYSELEDRQTYIIHIGSKEYYAPKYAKKHGYPNIDLALLEIFRHWNTDVVFNGTKDFTEQFTDVLKIKYNDKYHLVVNDIFSKNDNLNSKFYRLFYNHLYKGNSICKKFYFADGYQEREIRPLIENETDLYEQIYNRFDFMYNFCDCEAELLSYLSISNDGSSRAKKELLNNATKYINHFHQKIGYFTTMLDTRGRSYPVFKQISSSSATFIEELIQVKSLEEMENKIEFLKNYRILSNGSIIDRDDLFLVGDVVGTVDDGVYDILGISNQNSSVAKDYLKLYLVLIKEYITICEPKELKLNNITLSVTNFYNQLEDIIHNAYSKCIGNNRMHDDVKRLFLFVVLKENGILEYFVNKCNTSKVHILLSLIKTQIVFKEYMSADISVKKVYHEGKTLDINDYFADLIEYSDENQIADIILNNEIYKLLIESINEEDIAIVTKQISKTAKEI